MDKKTRVRRIWRDVKNFFRKKTSDYTKREPQLDLDEMEVEDQRKFLSTEIVRSQVVHKFIFFFVPKDGRFFSFQKTPHCVVFLFILLVLKSYNIFCRELGQESSCSKNLERHEKFLQKEDQ